ncbi:winged helix-turn-helix domain-containing protein [Shimwellia pseudoproteus]|uniref:winged helix-turn-helix domain-containing protein n=1 Tax=Shimwellia pseudoproteus TaxID=570012 RepID=UPI0018EB1F0C|nr:winged helix-turn-helix domain-containing protein [Shimwellia pseudoproteus]MBJ3815262.1 winged helix-turn-helix domain-containing protein [Shimwellia pseudoproteus]
MPPIALSLRQARRLQLSALGLLRKPRRHPRPADLLSAIEQMSLLQIDTINIVARSPYLVLFSRLGSYPATWLDDALATGQLFEYWAHEACFLPRQDFALVRHRMLDPQGMGWKYHHDWMTAHQQEIGALLAQIERHGPVRSADFSHTGKGSSGWWEWKPHKRHLEGLFTRGDVMVARRHNFQRVYDLTRRIMPEWDDARDLIPREQAEARMLENSARSLGIFRPEWLADYYRLRNVDLKPLLTAWLDSGSIIPVEVEQLGTMYLHQQQLPALTAALDGKLPATHTTVLSPFDPLVWDRRRAGQLFDFSYRLECYTPAHLRRYGYFVLPLLYRDALVGRMDSKMHRKAECFEVINLYLETETRITAGLINGIRTAITDFARWQGAVQIRLSELPPALAALSALEWEIPLVP